ncbi:response regulator [Bacillus sp. JJ1503]|uniref:response regulator n=1 Tax=Bacillus sp. JJ1503 TaxID=3122956 RepID=UPI002FFF4CC4
MDLKKYRNHLFQTMKNKLEAWLYSDEAEKIQGEEIYRFLHSIKGTSGTLQLDDLMILAKNLLDQLKEDDQKDWDQLELKTFLFPLIQFTYEYEHFNELVVHDTPNGNDKAPLIQIIDDDVSLLMFLKDALEENEWMVITHTNPEIAVKKYFEMKPDCLILDIELPNKDGFQVLKEIQEHSEKYFIPTIMISVNNSRQVRIEAYQKGADDFFKKPLDMDEFIVKVNRHLQRKKNFDQSVLIDELTQIYNRKYLAESLPRYFQDFKRTKQAFSVCLADIDFFKKINDTYGHLMGDRILKDFAQYLKQNTRSLDMVYRYGGEEFIIVFPKTSKGEAKNRLNEFIIDFSKIEYTYDEKSFSVTFSAGICEVNDESISVEEALKRADNSLYEAKRLGRARVECLQSLPDQFKKPIINISVIDDDVIIRTLLAQLLESLNIKHIDLNIKTFEDGPSFFLSEHAKENVNHFIILDGVMPIMDGLEVLQKIKQGDRDHKYKILMLTGRNSKKEIEQALKLGVDDYVTKPFYTQELRARIQRLLNQMK